jgi:hypothetical protein
MVKVMVILNEMDDFESFFLIDMIDITLFFLILIDKISIVITFVL